jgi:hypothetical protein
MKKILIIIILYPFLLCSQVVDIYGFETVISDSSNFFNKNLTCILKTTKSKLKLNDIDTAIKKDISLYLNSRFLKITNDNILHPVNIKKDDDSEYWILNIDMGHPVENFSIVPIYCNKEILVVNIIGFKRKLRNNRGYKKGYLYTLVYKIGDASVPPPPP